MSELSVTIELIVSIGCKPELNLMPFRDVQQMIQAC